MFSHGSSTSCKHVHSHSVASHQLKCKICHNFGIVMNALEEKIKGFSFIIHHNYNNSCESTYPYGPIAYQYVIIILATVTCPFKTQTKASKLCLRSLAYASP